MPRLFISRMLETFFRRKWLFLLPLVPFIALGVITVQGKGATYRSSGVILVKQPGSTILNNLTAGDSENPFGGENPATYTARQINTLLATDEFFNLVVDNAGLKTSVESGAVTEQTVRSTSAAANDVDLVAITSVTANPELSYRLADATINSYGTWLGDQIKKDSEQTADYYTRQGQPDRAEDARIAGEEQAGQASLRFQRVDDPKVPTAPEPHRKEDVITLVLYTGLGLLVAFAALVVATLMDRSVRYDEEIEAHLHLPVLGSVPDSRAAIKPLVL